MRVAVDSESIAILHNSFSSVVYVCRTYSAVDGVLTANQSECDDLVAILHGIEESLERMDVKLGRLVELREALEQAAGARGAVLGGLDVMTLLSLPDHLRRTAMILGRLDRATASQVSRESGGARALESSYLNQLVAMGHVKKEREGREVYFSIE